MRVPPKVFNYASGLIILFLVWKGLALAVGSPVLSSPERAAEVFLRDLAGGEFWGHLGRSAYRVVASLALAWLTAFPAGVLMGYSRRLDNLASPLVFVTYPVPKIVLLPIILLIFGLGDLSKIILVGLILFFQILVATRDGVKSIEPKYYDSLRSMGGTDRHILREVVLPAALPPSFTALRIGIGTAISVLFFAESFATASGLGFLIMDAWGRTDYGRLYVGIIGMSLLGIVLYEVVGALERRVCAWKEVVPGRAGEPSPQPARGLRGLPGKIRTYGELIKFGHTVFALPFALTAFVLAHRESPVGFDLIFWVIMAMVGARSAAMGFNRWADAEIDARNPRTADRELPRGAISRTETACFIAVSSLLFVYAASSISWLCFWLSWPVLAALFGYSYTKRITWASHLILGAVIGLAPLAVWVAVTGTLDPRILVLFLALCTYIAGFDILYACQDRDFDIREGLRSIPARFGVQGAMLVSALLHVVAFLALLALYFLFRLSLFYLGFLAVIGLLLVVEHHLVNPRDLSRIDVAFFQVNGLISILLLASLVTDEIVQRVF